MAKFDDIVNKLLLEITINLNNSFEWFFLTPKQVKEKYEYRWMTFFKVAQFFIDKYEYHVIMTNDNQIHFINYSDAVQQPEENVSANDLNVFSDISIMMKLAATIFSVIAKLAKWKKSFIIEVPLEMPNIRRNRSKIYKNLIINNYRHFLPDFELRQKDRKIMLFLPNPMLHKESLGLNLNDNAYKEYDLLFVKDYQLIL